MDFMRLLQSVEELLYEFVTWLLFYPLTLIRCLRSPLQMMAYAESELKDDDKGQYDDALSPPIFLLITLFLMQMLGPAVLAGRAEEPIGPLADVRNLLAFRAVAFSVFPLLFAVQKLRRGGARLTRKTLKPAFYSQCYVTVPFVLLFNIGTIVAQFGGAIPVTGGIILMAVGLVWFVVVETLWFAAAGAMGKGRAVAIAAWTTLQAAVLMLAIMIVTVLALEVPPTTP